MEKQFLCPNTTSDEAKYSAPVPFIGLYIAAASLVCFLLILSDVIHGITRKKRWFPCHFFSLNSVSLTLLSVVAKLPVDLTTEMPTVQDQLSKLTGTVFVCVCMGFMLPSLGGNSDAECFTNLAALSIFVVTVMVNIGIQMATGLISSFIPEHIIVMYCMSMMLITMWISSGMISTYKADHMSTKTNLLTKDKGTMFERLRLCYLHSNGANPQFALCKSAISLVASYVCLTCLVVTLQATFRSYKFWDDEGLSDYRWSMRLIIMSQTLSILLASLATASRFVALSHITEDLPSPQELDLISQIWESYPYLKAGIVDYVSLIATTLTIYIVGIHVIILFGVWGCVRTMVMHTIYKGCVHFMEEHTNLQTIQEYRKLLQKNGVWLGRWTIAKFTKDMERWMTSTENLSSISHVSQILSRTRPSPRYSDFKGKDDDISCLNLVFLARVTSVLTPAALNGHNTESLSEVFDLICFVERKMNFLGSETEVKSKLAKAMWSGTDFKTIVSKMDMNERQSDLGRALHIIEAVKETFSTFQIWQELDSMEESISGREYDTIEELCNYIEQMFVDILHIFLSQLPCAVYKHINECPLEEYEDNARLALKFLCQVKSLEGKVEWSFPDGGNFTGMISSQVPAGSDTATRMARSSQMSRESVHLVAVADADDMACNACSHDIIQVE